VARVRTNAKLALAAAAGAAFGALFSRWRRAPEAPPAPPDQRAEELRQKLAEARVAAADETDFEAAGMGAETLVEEPAPSAPPLDYVDAPPPVAEEPPPEPEPEPEPEPKPEAAAPREQRKKPAAPAEPPPADEFEAMRRRIHEEGRSAAEEMRRSGEKPDQA
jgi:outer membrane biosynthesis protein TonB